MDQLTETTRRAVEILLRDWTLWVVILTLVLVFAIYLYLNPRAVEFFTGGAKPVQKTLGELAKEDTESVKETDIEAAAAARGSVSTQ